jgi:hypothetical protein
MAARLVQRLAEPMGQFPPKSSVKTGDASESVSVNNKPELKGTVAVERKNNSVVG